MRDQIQAWAEGHWDKPLEVDAIVDMSGHSGKVFGFTVSGEGVFERLVIRLAPAGVPHKGSTDVLRQAPLLSALHKAGVKVPRVVDASGDTSIFGVPYLVMSRLPGRPLIMGPEAGESWLPASERQRAYNLSAELLASIHRFDVTTKLPNWETVRPLDEELAFWTKILHKGQIDEWISTGMGVRDELVKRLPARYSVGLVHGDFQTNNILFTYEHGALDATGVVDWEIASIGAMEVDLAWFLMMNDAKAWHPVERRGGVDLDEVIHAYQRAVGQEISNLNWYWAFAGFRCASIAALNIRLHRTGKKHDPAWERAAKSVPVMLSRATELLEIQK